MRIPLVGCVSLGGHSAVILRKKLLTIERLILDAYAVVFVNDRPCVRREKILKVHRCYPRLAPKKKALRTCEQSIRVIKKLKSRESKK